MFKRPFYTLIFLWGSLSLTAQTILVDDQVSPNSLVTDFLINNSCAQVRNIQTHEFEAGEDSPMGSFSANGTNFPFESGVILTTGRAKAAEGPNVSILSHGSSSWMGDLDLQQALGVYNTINACILEFEFYPLGDHIQFDYIFASEQYLSNPSPNQCNYTDGFAFLLQPLGADNWENLAVIPGTNIPVAVNTVRGGGTLCPEINSEYFDQFNTEEHPTNYNGQTVVLRAEATVVPQQWYRIKLVVADQGNNLYDSAIFLGAGSFEITKDLGPDRLFATSNPVCPNETIVLNATQTGATAYQWSLNGQPINGATATTYTPTESGTYSVTIDLGEDCFSTGSIQLDFAEFPPITTTYSLTSCDANNDNQSRFNLQPIADQLQQEYPITQVEFFTSEAAAWDYSNWITNRNQFAGANNQTLYIRVANEWGCVQILPLQLYTSAATAVPDPILVCLTPGATVVELNPIFAAQLSPYLPSNTDFQFYSQVDDAELAQNALFTLDLSAPKTLYVRGQQNGNCAGIWVFELRATGFTAEEILPENGALCPLAALTLTAPVATSYAWSNGATTRSISVVEPGTYSVELTNAESCTAIKSYTISEVRPPLYTRYQVTDFNSTANSIQILVDNPQEVEYSLDGINYQSSPVFTGLAAGEYHFFIRDTAGCTTIGPIPFAVMDFPRFFTPNADGINDTWNLAAVGTDPVYYEIYNRYGRLLYASSNQSSGWDGTYKGKALPSSDYWVRITKADGRVILGHFSLKR